MKKKKNIYNKPDVQSLFKENAVKPRSENANSKKWTRINWICHECDGYDDFDNIWYSAKLPNAKKQSQILEL